MVAPQAGGQRAYNIAGRLSSRTLAAASSNENSPQRGSPVGAMPWAGDAGLAGQQAGVLHSVTQPQYAAQPQMMQQVQGQDPGQPGYVVGPDGTLYQQQPQPQYQPQQVAVQPPAQYQAAPMQGQYAAPPPAQVAVQPAQPQQHPYAPPPVQVAAQPLQQQQPLPQHQFAAPPPAQLPAQQQQQQAAPLQHQYAPPPQPQQVQYQPEAPQAGYQAPGTYAEAVRRDPTPPRAGSAGGASAGGGQEFGLAAELSSASLGARNRRERQRLPPQ